MPLLSEVSTRLRGKAPAGTFLRGLGLGSGGGGGLPIPEGALFDWDASSITPQADGSDFTDPWADSLLGAEMVSSGTRHVDYRDGSVGAPPSEIPYLDLQFNDVIFDQTTEIIADSYASWTVALLMRHDMVVSSSFVWRGDISYPYIRSSGAGFIAYAGGSQTVFGNSRTGLWTAFVFSNDAGNLILSSSRDEDVSFNIGTSFPFDNAVGLGGKGNNNALKAIARCIQYPRALDSAERTQVIEALVAQGGLGE